MLRGYSPGEEGSEEIYSSCGYTSRSRSPGGSGTRYRSSGGSGSRAGRGGSENPPHLGF